MAEIDWARDGPPASSPQRSTRRCRAIGRSPPAIQVPRLGATLSVATRHHDARPGKASGATTSLEPASMSTPTWPKMLPA